jgi:hypothetical protein
VSHTETVVGDKPMSAMLVLWLRELDAAPQEDPDAPTMAELAQAWGTTVQTMARKVREFAKQGRVTVGRRFIENSSGARMPVPTYRLSRAAAPPQLPRPRNRAATPRAKARRSAASRSRT